MERSAAVRSALETWPNPRPRRSGQPIPWPGHWLRSSSPWPSRPGLRTETVRCSGLSARRDLGRARLRLPLSWWSAVVSAHDVGAAVRDVGKHALTSSRPASLHTPQSVGLNKPGQRHHRGKLAARQASARHHKSTVLLQPLKPPRQRVEPASRSGSQQRASRCQPRPAGDTNPRPPTESRH